ncbi:MAG TPA: universal stress protein [Acidobacteriaceae bacterium]|nr:universal stress protein [Acidobacteriaceae bacterium]
MEPAPLQKQNPPATVFPEAAKQAVLQKLVVAYDFSTASETALRYAIEIARTFHSEIVLAHIETPGTLSEMMDEGVAKAKVEILAERHELDQLSTQLQSQGIKASYLIQSGSPTDLLVQLISERKPDLLLMGAYGYHAADRITLGSTAEYLLRSVSCPVLIVGPSVAQASAHGIRLSEIVYASTLPTSQGRAQELARDLARKFAMHIHVVHIEPYATRVIDGARLRELEMREEKIADNFRRQGIGSSWTLRFGSQQDHILEQAKAASADLLCFGIVHPATDPSQMGPLSAIIRAAKCPILTVPGAA